MQLFTILSSVILLAGARPLPQTAIPADSVSLNSTTTISVQDALSLLSAGASASATSLLALTSSPPASGSASASITSAASAASVSASASGSAIASDSVLASALLNSTDSATPVFSSDSSVPTSLTDGSDSNSTDSASTVLSSDSTLPTVSSDNGTDTASAAASSATATNAGVSYIIPTAIPQACMVLTVPNVSASSVITASIADSTGVSSDSLSSVLSATDADTLSSVLSSVDTNTLSASATLSALNVSATDSLVSNSLAGSVAATASVSVGSAASSAVASILASSDASLSASAASATAAATDSIVAPLTLAKRIAQADLPSVAQSWQDLCLISGGDIFTNEPCVQLAGVNGINALLADADPCDQQDNADAMIDFAKSAGVTNSDALIANAIAYRQHPRNAFSINGITPSTPYCQTAPRNSELQGLVNAQLPDVNPGVFGGPTFGLVAFGDPSSCPFGTSPDVDSCGCS